MCHHRQVAFSASRDSLFVRDYAGERRRELDTAGRLTPSREIRAEFHPLVTPMIPLVTRSSPDPDSAGHDTPRKEKR
ncbi:MAG TPA: hypothetical protein VFV49_00960 [Thermoanaerobaculia bacterium]|nr:hypothetical protein [Thermoanaerobaculia bacterium]